MKFLLQHYRCAALAAVPLLLLAGPAGAEDRGSSGGILDNLFSRGEPQNNKAEPSDDSEITTRLDRLENQLRQMTGQIEQLQFRNQQLEQAFRGMQGGGTPAPGRAAAPQTLPLPAAPAAPSIPGRRSDVFDPAQSPGAPGAPRALGGGGPVTTAPAIPAEPEVAVGAPGGRGAGAPLDLSTMAGNAASEPSPRAPVAPGAQVATLPPSQSPKDEYDLAYGYVLRKDYALAEPAFRDFLKKNPGNELTPDATYWLGETMFQRQRYQDAADSFLIVVRNYDKSGKAPDALLRLGQSLAALGQKDMACASLNEIERKYPKAPASVKRGVTQEQKRAHC
ncbi:MAG: tol-pal system protein YbgF [Pseudolabrys sp.]